ncbi:hypothetical protein DH2020_027331 [Rehmannia glutinosa]|uniref:Uncharacterized protein n=1 Tax=Rehmannia glutinosa TaxID=99300 RepID=A0ABR0VX87_REHGL
MENSDSTPPIPPPAVLSVELAESRQELLGRIQNLKQDLQNWRMKLDTQVMVYRDELSELKKSLNTEVEQLRTLQDDSGDIKEAEGLRNVENTKEIAKDLPGEDNGKEAQE